MIGRRNQYHHVRLEKIIEYGQDFRTFRFNHLPFRSSPGQFVMVWLPGVDEKPFSLSTSETITVKKVGPFTEKLFEKKKGDYLDVRGPYGNGFPEVHECNIINLIGGGCGIAPLFYFMTDSTWHINRFVMAGKTKSDLIFLSGIERMLGDRFDQSYLDKTLIPVTEDGSYGEKGLATDVDIPKSDYPYYICGPEIMMAKVAEKLVEQGVKPSKIYLSMERYMKCAMGICGECSFDGYRVCADGPVFTYDKVKDLPHFNRMHRTRTGELVEK
jgi:dihydroorotate dehydrogenase electron transfer subunit